MIEAIVFHDHGEESWLHELIASQAPGVRGLQTTLHEHPETTEVTWLVGPEGDFSREETESALAAGFLPVSLGTIVLRVETATLYGLSVLRYEYGERL